MDPNSVSPKLWLSVLREWRSLFSRIWSRITGKQSKSPSSVAIRFVQLFEAHGVSRVQIPEFFGHGLGIATVSDNDALFSALAPEMIFDASVLFGVNPEWIYGESEEVYVGKDFYKHPEAFAEFLDDLRLTALDGQIRIAAVLPINRAECDSAIIVISELVGRISGRFIWRYHLLNNWRSGYWKSHGYYMACLMLAVRRGIYPEGLLAAGVWMERYEQGVALFEYSKNFGGEVDIRGVGRWRPLDEAETPEAFLARVEPEAEGFGHRQALELWITLCQRSSFVLFDNNEELQIVVNAFKSRLSALSGGADLQE